MDSSERPASVLMRARDDAERSPSGSETPAQLVTACEELLFDAVIPIVYPQQPITVPFSAISDGMTTMQWLALSVQSSVRSTFTRADTDPPLRIVSETDDYVKVAGLGHAGVAIINGETGETKYYEYGRYGGNYGAVRERTVANVQMGNECNPTPESLDNLARDLTRTNGGPYGFEAAYIKLADGAFERMKEFAQQRTLAVNSRTALAYDISNNHCFTFSTEVANAGGASANVSSAPDLEVILISRIGTRVDAPDDLAVELPSRQIQVLQQSYTPFSVGRDGTVPSGFSPPRRP